MIEESSLVLTENISQLKNLKELILRDDQISTIPKSIGNL
jgi:Leucine-rich repeat (LRR) protein